MPINNKNWDIPLDDEKSLPFDTIFNSRKNFAYRAFKIVKNSYCPDCFKMPFELPSIDDDSRTCCAEFLIATFNEDWEVMFNIATKAIKSTFSDEIGEDRNAFIKNCDEAIDDKLNQMKSFKNLLNQQSVTENSTDDKFLEELESEASCLRQYEKASEDLKSSSINCVESRKSLIQTTTNSIANEEVRLAKEFLDRLSPNGTAISDDDILSRLNHDPNLEK